MTTVLSAVAAGGRRQVSCSGARGSEPAWPSRCVEGEVDSEPGCGQETAGTGLGEAVGRGARARVLVQRLSQGCLPHLRCVTELRWRSCSAGVFEESWAGVRFWVRPWWGCCR